VIRYKLMMRCYIDAKLRCMRAETVVDSFHLLSACLKLTKLIPVLGLPTGSTLTKCLLDSKSSRQKLE
jgi:hypothetical protein